MAIQVFYKQLLHRLSQILVVCNVIMVCAGIVAMLSFLDPWLDILLEDIIIGTSALNMAFLVILQTSLNWKKNPVAARIHRHFSGYLAAACATIIANVLVTATDVLVQSLASPLHGLARALAIAMFVLTHLLAIAGGYRSVTTSRMGERSDGGSGIPAWRFDGPITDDPDQEQMPAMKVALKASGIGSMILLLALAVYGPFVFLGAGDSIQYWAAGNLSIFAVFLILPVIFLLARQVPRTRRTVHKLLLATVIIASSTIAVVNTVPLIASTTATSSIEEQFNSAFGAGWAAAIPGSVSSHFRSRPVAIKDIVLAMPILATDELVDIPYMQDKGQWLKFDWYGPAGISATNTLLPLIIALHPSSWRMLDKGASNVIPTSRYLASQGYVVVDVQYGLCNDSAGSFSLKDMVLEIATLTRFLDTNAIRYHVNLSCTFFLGRSAGAHLALVAGLGYGLAYFAGNFSASMVCRGVVAYYPATDLGSAMDTNASLYFFGVPMVEYGFFNPVDLVSPSCPPVLCFHGTADGIIPVEETTRFREVMVASGGTCIAGIFDGAGHMFDIFYNNFYNQICIYYIERFLALRCV
jgi:acetyl esterase/lipase